MILPVPRVHGVYRGLIFFLLSTDYMYSHVPGDQGGPIVFRLRIFFGGCFPTNWCSTICITCPILREIECNKSDIHTDLKCVGVGVSVSVGVIGVDGVSMELPRVVSK